MLRIHDNLVWIRIHASNGSGSDVGTQSSYRYGTVSGTYSTVPTGMLYKIVQCRIRISISVLLICGSCSERNNYESGSLAQIKRHRIRYSDNFFYFLYYCHFFQVTGIDS